MKFSTIDLFHLFNYDSYVIFAFASFCLTILSFVGFFLFLKDNYFFKKNKNISQFFLISMAVFAFSYASFSDLANGIKEPHVKVVTQSNTTKKFLIELTVNEKFNNFQMNSLLKQIKNLDISNRKIFNVDIIEED
jgi:hypothetical protein